VQHLILPNKRLNGQLECGHWGGVPADVAVKVPGAVALAQAPVKSTDRERESVNGKNNVTVQALH